MTKEEIIDNLVRDICSISVAPAAKSKVRSIVSKSLSSLEASIEARKNDEFRALIDAMPKWKSPDEVPNYGQGAPGPLYVAGMAAEARGCKEMHEKDLDDLRATLVTPIAPEHKETKPCYCNQCEPR